MVISTFSGMEASYISNKFHVQQNGGMMTISMNKSRAIGLSAGMSCLEIILREFFFNLKILKHVSSRESLSTNMRD